jgi:hypothetical protein
MLGKIGRIGDAVSDPVLRDNRECLVKTISWFTLVFGEKTRNL